MWKYKETRALKNWCFWTVVLEKTLESPLECKEIKPVNPKGRQSRLFIWNTDAEAETQYFSLLMQRTDSLEKPRSWERLDVGEGDDTGWDGWMASLTQWTWAWVGSRSWWWTGKPSMQQSMGHRVGHDWTTVLNWTELKHITV